MDAPQEQTPPAVDPPSQPVISNQPLPEPAKTKNWLLIVLVIFAILCSLGATIFIIYQQMQQKQNAAVTTYASCIAAPGSVTQTSYPAVCVTRDGKRFPQPLTDEEQKSLLPPVEQEVFGIQLTQCCSCPTLIKTSQIGANGWVAYEQGKDYTADRPSTCSQPNIGVCAPCSQPTSTTLLCDQLCSATGIPYTCKSGLSCLGVTQKQSDANSGQGFGLQMKCRNPECPNDTSCLCKTPIVTFTCPANGWVDCMPGPNPKPQCSSTAMAWYKANCPNFKGGAL
jgi:hypothetical protein